MMTEEPWGGLCAGGHDDGWQDNRWFKEGVRLLKAVWDQDATTRAFRRCGADRFPSCLPCYRPQSSTA